MWWFCDTTTTAENYDELLAHPFRPAYCDVSILAGGGTYSKRDLLSVASGYAGPEAHCLQASQKEEARRLAWAVQMQLQLLVPVQLSHG